MSKHYTMKNPRIEVEFRSSEEATAKGGVFAVKAFAEESGLWDRVKCESSLEARKDTSRGYEPVVYVATFLFGFASGGASMADFERLNDEPGLKRFLGIKRFPDETTLAEWMRSIGDKGAEALMRINREFIAWSLERIAPERLLHGGELEWFFDDTQLEVTGKCFESAAMNYEGTTTLSWQTLWAGPFVACGQLGGGNRDCSELLPQQLEQCEALMKDRKNYLYADSGSSAGKYLNTLSEKVNRFSVSYNKWTDGLERCAKELPESAWSTEQIIRWRDGKEHRAQHGWLRYQPEGCDEPQLFAVTRHQLAEGELFWRYAFICCEPTREQSAGLAIERHKLKGDKERQFSQVLTDMDLHHPPCKSLAANQVFYALGALAHNLLQAIKLLYLPDHEQPIRIRTLLHVLMLIPVTFKRHARQLKAVCCVNSRWLPWWRKFAHELDALSALYRLRPSPG
jgi:hypothetical protein